MDDETFVVCEINGTLLNFKAPNSDKPIVIYYSKIIQKMYWQERQIFRSYLQWWNKIYIFGIMIYLLDIRYYWCYFVVITILLLQEAKTLPKKRRPIIFPYSYTISSKLIIAEQLWTRQYWMYCVLIYN